MGRPRTDIGTFGDFSYLPTPNGKVKARVRFRDDDGRLRLVQATGGSRKSAERALKHKLSRRDSYAAGSLDLSGDSTFGVLVDVWLDDLDVTGKLAPSTRSLYERNMRQLVLPVFEHYALREITVRKVDQFIKTLATAKSYSMAKQARTVMSLAFGLAVRYDAMRSNPVRDTARLRKPPSQAMSLTLEQVEAIRWAAQGWRRADGLPGPRPDGQLEQIIDVMLGTSARIGEVLAIRRCDIDVTTSPATVRICGTIVSPTGKPTHRQAHPKTARSSRTVSVPSFAAEVLRDRMAATSSDNFDHLLFFSRNGTPLTTNNVRRRLRAVLVEAGIEGVTPHSFRRTVATVLDRAGGADLAAEMLGHTSSQITKDHYIQPDEKVNPVTAEILESLAPRRRTADG
ncbi:integrase [Nocardioides sp. Root1257]|uniref:tyrosine-type recombinase/integrase n=1 Tax=unclassified Nocardioides TaxID=2615069 RepID=UPI0006F395EF|nr:MULTISPECIES: site-specific integrase [unclassified Nocardioides]KQW45070.1 integrase [Nocardioides sp. Root1257]KRC45926.1 integrase [Nocardioides sp. Root224]